ncbi:MAG: hypothetical protein IH627_20570 [Rubrivivax sp.]|nr:hypothetical protein [Rubrivivax sp.]
MEPPAFLDNKDRKMKFINKALVAAAALAALSAQAEGLYVGGSIGASRYSDDFGGAFTDRSDTGLKLYGGYVSAGQDPSSDDGEVSVFALHEFQIP